MKDEVPLEESCDNVLQYLESSGSELGFGKLAKLCGREKIQGKMIWREINFLHFFTGYLDFFKNKLTAQNFNQLHG